MLGQSGRAAHCPRASRTQKFTTIFMKGRSPAQQDLGKNWSEKVSVVNLRVLVAFSTEV